MVKHCMKYTGHKMKVENDIVVTKQTKDGILKVMLSHSVYMIKSSQSAGSRGPKAVVQG